MTARAVAIGTPQRGFAIIPSTVGCAECGRIFSLLVEEDAAEWYYGHDCEVAR